jgi:hypothetical protein
MPGFQVAMGYGLHVGWAIEGAIGELVRRMYNTAMSSFLQK